MTMNHQLHHRKLLSRNNCLLNLLFKSRKQYSISWMNQNNRRKLEKAL
jgi:hypothetical protein